MSDDHKKVHNIDYLCIGHCCHDVADDGFVLGGSASYASLVVKSLGKKPAILTSFGPDFEFQDFFRQRKIPLHVRNSGLTTVFENIYEGEIRQQYLRAQADILGIADIPKGWEKIPVIHLCPIAGEIDPGLCQVFRQNLVAMTIQGFLRDFDEKGKVVPCPMDWQLLRYADIVILSNEDIIGIEGAMSEILNHASHVVVTKGSQGATVYFSGEKIHFPSFPVKLVDATGAGDAFAAAYILRFYESAKVKDAAVFAHCVASFVVEGKGLVNLPEKTVIEQRIENYRQMFTDYA